MTTATLPQDRRTGTTAELVDRVTLRRDHSELRISLIRVAGGYVIETVWFDAHPAGERIRAGSRVRVNGEDALEGARMIADRRQEVAQSRGWR